MFLLFCAAAVCMGLDAETLRQAQQAIVVVGQEKGHGCWTGFCCDSKRRLILTDRALLGKFPRRQLTVVLSPGTKEQRAVEAELVRWHEGTNLALLRLPDTAGELRELRLGSDSGLAETTPVTTFRFPFERALPKDPLNFPTPRLDTGRISALQKAPDGSLQIIRADMEINAASCGGPLLDEKGNVLGLVFRKPPPSSNRWTLAIPADQIRSFLNQIEPKVTFSPETVPWHHRYEPVEVIVEGIRYADAQTEPLCHIDVGEGATTRSFTIRAATGSIKLPPLPTPLAPIPLQARVEMADTTVTTSLMDRQLMLNGEPWHLHDIARIGSNGAVRLQSGEEFRATVTGIESVDVEILGRRIEIPFAQVNALHILDTVDCEPSVPYKAWFSDNGNDSPTVNGRIPIRRWLTAEERGTAPRPAHLPASLDSIDWGSSAPPSGQERISLPAKYTDCVRAGGGRYLILPMPFLCTAAIVDLAGRQLKACFELPSPRAIVAGGRSTLCVADPATRTVERWTLNPLERTHRVVIPLRFGTIEAVAMGAASDDWVYVVDGNDSNRQLLVLDGTTLGEIPVQMERFIFNRRDIPARTLSVADSGMAFALCCENKRVLSGRLVGSTVALHQVTNCSWNTHALPGLLGERLHTSGIGDLQIDLSDYPSHRGGEMFVSLPSAHPLFRLGATIPQRHPEPGWEAPPLSVYASGQSAPLFPLPFGPAIGPQPEPSVYSFSRNRTGWRFVNWRLP